MSFIKKYSILLVPVGIALAAGVVIVLTILTSRSLARDIAANSLRQNGQVTSLLREPHSERQPDVEKMRQDRLANDVNGVVSLAMQCTLRELINYGIFPPKDDSQQLFDEYGQKYRDAVDSLVRSMQALEAPSDMEIRDALNEGTPTTTGGVGGYMGNYNYGRSGMSGATRGNDSTKKAMLDAICSKRAREIRVYANPTLFRWYEYWGDFQYAGGKSAIQDCWYSQLAYWIYEDVVATINKLNAASDNIASSPVKRLLGVSFREAVDYPKNTGRAGYGGIGLAAGRSYARAGYDDGMFSSRGDAPEYIRYAEGGVLGVETWMGRVCNDDIDVVHFSVGVVTSSSAVRSFMVELCSEKQHLYRKDADDDAPMTFRHNQIGILKSEVIAVERDAPENANYRYGDEAVVRVDLVCEYIFNRAGYDKIKPESIKVQLGQAEPPEGAPGAPGAPSLGRSPIRPGVRPTAPPTGTGARGQGRDLPELDI